MLTLRKHIDCGDYSFDVCVNRDIAVKALEEFPELSAYVFKTAKENAKTKNTSKIDEVDVLIKNIREKKTSELYEQEENLQKCVAYAFPLMLKAADSNIDAAQFIDYATKNGVIDEFNAAMYEFILMGFTQRETIAKKVGFSIKTV